MPDQIQRDQARARLPLPGAARIVVLGSTAGAGQTVTTLLTGQMLTILRGEPVAVLDLGTGPGSLTELARQVPRLLPAPRKVTGPGQDRGPQARERGLQVVTADGGADQERAVAPPEQQEEGRSAPGWAAAALSEQPQDAGELIDAVVARYPLMLADPAAGHVPRALHAADQLVLVTPASADAARSLAMTLEWLEAHGRADLGRSAITVLNGVSGQTARYAERAAAVASGRCRAIVRVPWDPRLQSGGPVGPAAIYAYTALAGLVVSALAGRALPGSALPGSALQGSALPGPPLSGSAR